METLELARYDWTEEEETTEYFLKVIREKNVATILDSKQT